MFVKNADETKKAIHDIPLLPIYVEIVATENINANRIVTCDGKMVTVNSGWGQTFLGVVEQSYTTGQTMKVIVHGPCKVYAATRSSYEIRVGDVLMYNSSYVGSTGAGTVCRCESLVNAGSSNLISMQAQTHGNTTVTSYLINAFLK